VLLQLLYLVIELENDVLCLLVLDFGDGEWPTITFDDASD